jgi:predicted ATPase/DNA-binding winged helix-turn-helix (wHTH) protein
MKRFNTFQLDIVNECILRDGHRLALTSKAFAIARYLIDHAGRLVTKGELMDEIWPDIYVQEANLKVYVRELRIALGDQAAEPLFIETRWGKGYSFIAPVSDEPVSSPACISSSAPTKEFGRDAELRRLQVWFEKALRGERQIVFITGETGIGKTALVDAFSRQTAQPALRIASGQCIQDYQEQEAYYPLLEALGRLTGDPTVIEILNKYAPSWLQQFPSLVSEAELQHSRSNTEHAAPQRMLREVCDLIDALTLDSPLLLCLEDVQWSDLSTVSCIAALAQRREPARLMLLVTYRPVDAILSQHPIRRLKLELQTHRLCNELALEGLDKSAVSQILVNRYSVASIPDSIARLMHKQTDGNPLFLEMSLDYLEALQLLRVRRGSLELCAPHEQISSTIPESLRQVIERYIEGISEDEAEMLTAASVIGIEFDDRY